MDAALTVSRANPSWAGPRSSRAEPKSRAGSKSASSVRVRVRLRRPLSGARKADIQHVNTEVFHKVHQLNLVFDGGVGHRRRLKTVTERLIIEVNRLVR